MSYTDKVITEILASVQKIGIAKTSRLFNISCATISRWLKNKPNLPKEKKIKTNPEKNYLRKLVLRRIHLENGNIDCYIYNLKDLHTEFEFNSISYNPNYKTPIIFLKYILFFYLKETNIRSFQILIKGSTRINNLDKFNNLIDNCKIEVLKTDDRFSIDSFIPEKLSQINDNKTLNDFLTDNQLCYNIKRNKDNLKNLKFCLPEVLDEFKPDQLMKNTNSEMTSSLERLITKTDNILRNTDYNLAWDYIEIIRVIIKKIKDKKVLIQYYGLIIEYYSMQGNYGKILEFLTYSLKKINAKLDEVKFFLILKICKIHITNFNIKEFDHFFDKIEIVDFKKFSKDFIMEFHLMMVRRRTLYKSIEESIKLYKDILSKHIKYISQKKLFDIYIQISTLNKDISNFKEAHICLDKACSLSEIQNDKYLLCEHHLLKFDCFIDEGLLDEAFELCTITEKLSEECNFRDYYYECKIFKACYYLEKGENDLAIIEADKVLDYGKATSNNFIIFIACRVLQIYYSRVGNITKVLKYNKIQLQLSKLFFNAKYEADSLLNLCVALSKLPVTDELLYNVEELIELNKIIKDPITGIKALTLKACYYQLKKENNFALKYYKQALQSAKKGIYFNLISLISSHIAIINRDMKKFRSAVYYINESIYYYNRLNTKYDLPRLTFIKAKIYFEANDLIRAHKYIIEANKFAQIYNKNFLNSCLALEELITKQKV